MRLIGRLELPAFRAEDFPGFTEAQIIAGFTVPAVLLTEAEIEATAKVCPVFRYNMTGAR